MTRKFLLLNTAAIAVAGAVGFTALHFMQRPDAASNAARRDPGQPAASRPDSGKAEPAKSEAARIGGPFALTNHNGKRVTDVDFSGRYRLIFFGFVNCPDVCPTGLHAVSEALAKLGRRAKDVAPIFVTVDPERDTPGVLKTYLSNFHPSFTGLTGSAAEIKPVADAYRVAYGREEGKSENYTVFHTALVYFMDRDGAYIAHFRHSDSPEAMAKSVLSYMNR